MRSVAWLSVAVLAIVSAPSGFAQPGGNPGAPRRAADPAENPGRRDEIKKKIRAMRAYTLTEELSLDEATAGKLFPVLARYDDETDRLLQKRGDIQRRLRRADTLHDARAVERLIEEALVNRRAFWDLEDRRIGDLRKILTPVQSAKLLVVLPALERKIENQLRKAIQRQNAGDE